MKINWKTFAAIAAQVTPIALSAAGAPPEVVGKVTHLIVLAEQSGQSGADKKAFVLDAFKTGAGLTDDLVHPGVADVDPQQLTDAVSAGIDGVIAMIHAVQNIPVKKA